MNAVSVGPARAPLRGRRFILVAGKGGVGRTTVAATLSLALARQGRKVLLAQVQAQRNVAPYLGGEAPVTDRIAQVNEHLAVVNMQPAAALREYGELVFRSARIAETIFENRAVSAFLRAIPGLDDYAMLGKAWYHTTTGTERDHFDVVVVDAPASGHLLAMLRIPKVLAEGMPEGPLVRDARTIRAMLCDEAATALVLVTLGEELPVREAIELAGKLKTELAMTVSATVVNRIFPRPCHALAAETGDAQGAAEPFGVPKSLLGDAVIAAAIDHARRLERLRARQEEFVSQLLTACSSTEQETAEKAPMARLPLLPKAELTAEDACTLMPYLEELI